DPRVIFFIGVAGSLKSDVHLGHVVASTKNYHYPSGKAERTLHSRPDIENTSHRLAQLARFLRRRTAWLARIKGDIPGGASSPAPIVHVGPIAAGEQVVADEKSHTYQHIKRDYGDALAVEMEGYGTLAAANLPKIDAIVIRGISDRVSDKTES